ncbi:chitin synthase N-terminal-domain-containing protein, partial [Blyttiomyces helicus]
MSSPFDDPSEETRLRLVDQDEPSPEAESSAPPQTEADAPAQEAPALQPPEQGESSAAGGGGDPSTPPPAGDPRPVSAYQYQPAPGAVYYPAPGAPYYPYPPGSYPPPPLPGAVAHQPAPYPAGPYPPPPGSYPAYVQHHPGAYIERSDPRASYHSDYVDRDPSPNYPAAAPPFYQGQPRIYGAHPRGAPPPPQPQPAKRTPTTLQRRVKTVKLSPSGNFVIKQRVPQEVLAGGNYDRGEEFESMRYTAATCDPDNYIEEGYNLRCVNYLRHIEIFVVVTMYNEDHEGFNRTMFGLAQNIKYLCEKN